MTPPAFSPLLAESTLIEALADTPVVLIHRPRQSGKTTFTAGVVLYDGETSAGFGDRFYAVPIRLLWEMT